MGTVNYKSYAELVLNADFNMSGKTLTEKVEMVYVFNACVGFVDQIAALEGGSDYGCLRASLTLTGGDVMESGQGLPFLELTEGRLGQTYIKFYRYKGDCDSTESVEVPLEGVQQLAMVN